jgi:hypothetical protein
MHKPKAPVEVGTVDDLSSIIKMLDNAVEAGKKYPKIHFETNEHEKLLFARAGDRSKEPGSVNITDGGPFGDNTWYGKISRDGQFAPNNRVDGEMLKRVAEALNKMAENPEAAAKAYGRTTGHCCFCSRELTNKASVENGYGPICAAKHF